MRCIYFQGEQTGKYRTSTGMLNNDTKLFELAIAPRPLYYILYTYIHT